MADPTDGGRRDQDTTRPTGDDRIAQRLETLDARLDQVRTDTAHGQPAHRDGRALGQGFRIASELVASILVGGVIGWQLDKWLGTQPVLLIIFFLLGTAAGMRSVMRAANSLSTTPDQAEPRDPDPGTGPDST